MKRFMKWSICAPAIVLIAASTGAAQAQTQAPAYPTKPVHLVVPYAAGGGIDLVARMVGAPLAESLKQPVLTENKPGANGVLATQEVARLAPDGYSLLLGVPATIAINPSVYKLNVDTLKGLQPVAALAVARFVIVTAANSGIDSLPKLVASAKAEPGKYSFASYGSGSASHLAGEMLNVLAGIKTTHIPYKGSAAALPDVMSGRVDFMFDVVANVQPHVQSGRLKVIAVAGDQSLPQFPDAPPANSIVPGLSLDGWVGLFAPTGTPTAVIDRLNSEVNVSLQTPELRARLEAAGFDILGGAPGDLARIVQRDYAIYSRAARSAGLRND